MEKAFYVRYSSEKPEDAHVALEKTELDAAKWLYNHYPANNDRKFPIYVRWYDHGQEKQALFSVESRGGLRRVA